MPVVLSLAALGLGAWARRAGGHGVGIAHLVAASVVITLVLVAVVWVLLAVPLSLYGFLALIVVADHVSCTPDAYECPL